MKGLKLNDFKIQDQFHKSIKIVDKKIKHFIRVKYIFYPYKMMTF
jgi:hypothetical protein